VERTGGGRGRRTATVARCNGANTPAHVFTIRRRGLKARRAAVNFLDVGCYLDEGLRAPVVDVARAAALVALDVAEITKREVIAVVSIVAHAPAASASQLEEFQCRCAAPSEIRPVGETSSAASDRVCTRLSLPASVQATQWSAVVAA